MSKTKIIKIYSLLVLLLLSIGYSHLYAVNLSGASTSDEHIVWDKQPIEIVLPVGKERLISFPATVQFGYDANALSDSVLRVQNDDQTIYLLASKPFNTQRVEAKLASGEIILLDLSASSSADDDPIDIVLPTNAKNVSPTSVQQYSNQMPINYMTLMRYAIQQLYAPKQLLTAPSNVTRFPMDTAHTVPLSYDSSILALPLASWRGGDLYVTAMQVKNTLSKPLRLDPRLLCGNWQAASFYPNVSLAPTGAAMAKDTSTLFAISTEPFAVAISQCVNNT